MVRQISAAISGSMVKSMKAWASSGCGAEAGITRLSMESVPPSFGTTYPRSGSCSIALANWPFQPWASQTSPESSTSSKFVEL